MKHNLRRLSVLGMLAGLVVMFLATAVPGEKSAAAAVTTFEVGLSGLNEVPPVSGPGAGFARFTFDDVTRVLTYDVTVFGLSADQVTAAHIHRGAAGVNGPIVHFLSATGFMQASGRITLSEADVADLRAGNFYVNVHSVANPGGFARGQMYLSVQDALTASARTIVDLYNRKNLAFLNYFTDNAIQNVFGGTRAEVAANPAELFGGPPIAFRSLRVVSQAGSTAITETELQFGQQVERVRHHWILDGVWKIDDEEDIPEVIPSGATLVDVKMQEFAFVFDSSRITSGNLAFRAENVGRQPHETALVSIKTNETLAQVTDKLAKARLICPRASTSWARPSRCRAEARRWFWPTPYRPDATRSSASCRTRPPARLTPCWACAPSSTYRQAQSVRQARATAALPAGTSPASPPWSSWWPAHFWPVWAEASSRSRCEKASQRQTRNEGPRLCEASRFYTMDVCCA
jgi:hypothetical protein